MRPGQRAHAALAGGEGHLGVIGRGDVQHLRAARVLGHGAEAARQLGGVGGVAAGVARCHGGVGLHASGDELGCQRCVWRAHALGGGAARETRVVHHHHLAGLLAQCGQRILQKRIQHQAVAGHQHFAAFGRRLVARHLAAVARVVDEDLVAVGDALVQAHQAVAHAHTRELGVADLRNVLRRHTHGSRYSAGVGSVEVNARQVRLGVAVVADPHDERVVGGQGRCGSGQCGGGHGGGSNLAQQGVHGLQGDSSGCRARRDGGGRFKNRAHARIRSFSGHKGAWWTTRGAA